MERVAEHHRSRPFAEGAFEFVVDTTEHDDALVIDALLRDLPVPATLGAAGAVLSVRRAPDGSRILSGPRLGDRRAATLDEALKYLLTAVNLCALDAEPDDLHLHAAAATKGGRAVVLVAARDVGKTTTIAHLVTRGWDYVTDETVRLSAGSDDVTGLPKPLSVKPNGRERVAHLEPWMVPADGDDRAGFRFVPIGATGAAVSSGGRPHLVVVLRRGDDLRPSRAVATRTHPADAAVALMQDTLDAERFGIGAAERLCALCAASDCYELTMGSPHETADALGRIWSDGPVEPMPVRALPASDAFHRGVVSILVGDRALVHDVDSGTIFALDEGATRIWSRLGGWSIDDPVDVDIDVDGPVAARFVAQLRALGVLAASS